MSGKITLGGERLGSGKKMDVEMHGFERSSHDLSYIWRSTMSAGTLVPFLTEVALPGDSFDIRLNCDVKTHPTIGPLFGSYKVQLDVFQVPMRLYHSALHNNRLGIGMNMAQIKLPKLNLTGCITDPTISGDVDNAQINASCLLSYLGIRGVGFVGSLATEGYQRKFNAIPFLAYWEIFKQYYANKQEENAYVIHNIAPTFDETVTSVTIDGNALPSGTGITIASAVPIVAAYTGATPSARSIMIRFSDDTYISMYDLCNGNIIDNATDLEGVYTFGKYGNRIALDWRYATPEEWGNTRPELAEFPLAQIDEMKDIILSTNWNVELIVNDDNPGAGPYNWIVDTFEQGGITKPYTSLNQEGLAVKTYQSDLFNNWLSTEWIDGTGGINEITAIDTSGGSFNIDTLNLSKKVYDMLNRIAVSGGSYNDWLNAVYDHDSFRAAESPIYCGGLIKELVFQEVVSNAVAVDEGITQPLGTLAGKGVMGQKHKGGDVTIRVDEPSYIMGIVSLTPRLDYSQGNKWDVNLDTLDDLHKPSLDQIGFQELITEQMAYWTTAPTLPALQWTQKSAGKQPAWINYMTNVNQVRGNFAIRDNEMFMTLNRRYEVEETVAGDLDIADLTTYIDPAKFNFIFAQTALDAQNFWTQISIDMFARRKMSAKVIPNL